MPKKSGTEQRKRWVVFCDESGNTGTNHVDDTQPYYVLSGWLVSEANLSSARDAARVELQPIHANQTELKGSELMKTAAGRARVASLASSLGKAGALPFFVASNKRYSLAGRFVDYFLDPIHNPRIWPEWFRTKEIRRGFATEIAALPPAALDTIQDVLRSGTVTDAERCATTISDALRTAGNLPLALKVAGVVGRTATVVDELTAKDGPKSKGVSPNFSAFVTALQMLGRQARAKRFDLRVVHDETSSFEATFVESYEALSHLDATTPLGREIERVAPGTLPLSSLQGLSFEVSHAEPLVQASDTLAAAVCWLLRGDADESRRPGDPAAEMLAMHVFALLVDDRAEFAHVVASDDQLLLILSRLKLLGEAHANRSDEA